MKILAIESSCDETAAAIVEDGVRELASVVATSKELHEKTGGIVPEVAARKQADFIVPVVDQAMQNFGGSVSDIDAIAVTVGPGLVGSLIVGIEAAKALAVAWDKPLIPVNHMIGHIYANFLGPDFMVSFPALALIVSGGHTDLVLLKAHGVYEHIGGTLDDAAGEAFDKTARILGISKYLGGALLSKKAQECENNTISGALPRPMIGTDDYDFSFSGLKTAVKNLITKNEIPVEVVCREFEDAVVEVLVAKTVKAAKNHKVSDVILGGGVSANSKLRAELKSSLSSLGVNLHAPSLPLCTDNAVYIAAAAYFNQIEKPLEEIQPNPSLGVTELP